MTMKRFAVAMGASMLIAAPAHAAFINGSLSFADGFDLVPAPPNLACIVDCGVDNFDINNTVNVYAAGSATGAFAGTTSALAPNDLNPFALPFVMYTTDTGFAFTVTSYSPRTNTGLSCAGGLCLDSVAYNFVGTVIGGLFDATAFNGVWTANGSCSQITGGVGCVAGTQSGSWSSSVVALGRPVPEPGTLALLGLGLAGLAGMGRRRR